MTWFRVDDQFPTHPKVRAAGFAGRALWLAAGTMCAARNTDGIVEALVVKDAAYLAEVDSAVAVAGLVSSGLWHDEKTIRRCIPCKEAIAKLPGAKLPARAFFFHDWLDYQLTRDQAKVPVERRLMNRRKALGRDTDLRDAILDRDGTLCRYCEVRVDFKDHHGPHGGTYDHVDPDGDNTLDNVVVACRQCNSRKGHRTPEEAGMTLLPPPQSSARVQLGAKSSSTRAEAEAKGSRSRLVSTESDRVGPEFDSAPAGVEPGSAPSWTPAEAEAKTNGNGNHL